MSAVPRATAEKARIPVSILTGFLGSGKTTLLNRLLKQPAMAFSAIVVNEFGEIGIDHLLVETSTEQMIEMSNGCVCCTIRGDLAGKLGSLAMWLDAGRIPQVDRVIVETTGLADPAPIMHTLMAEPELLERFRLSRVLTLVDAVAGAASLERFPEALKQVAVADTLIVSKTDLVDGAQARERYGALRRRIHELNPRASMYESRRDFGDAAFLFGTAGADAAETLSDLSRWLARREPAHSAGEHDESDCHEHANAHAAGSGAITTFVIELPRPVERERFDAFLRDLAAEFGERLLRVKGLVHVAGEPERPAVVHGVQHVYFPVTWLACWPDADRTSRLVFIVHALDPGLIRERFARSFA